MCVNHCLTRVSVSVSPRANQISSSHVNVNRKQYTQTKLSKIVGLVKFYRTEKLCLCGGLDEQCLQQSPSFNHWALVGTVEGSLVG